jgi:3-oxoadipate enol-lactonase
MTETATGTRRAHSDVPLTFTEYGPPHGRALVLLHSLGSDGQMWQECIDRLARDQRVLVPDSRGHGASAGPVTASIDEWVADLDAVLEAAGARDAVLVGVSLGGIQAIAYAAQHPDRVTGLVVADSFVHLPPAAATAKIGFLTEQVRRDPMPVVADQYIEDTFLVPLPAGAESVRRSLAAMDKDSYLASVRACFGVDIRDRLAHVIASSLVLWGDRDAKTPRALSDQITAGISGAQLQVVPDAGHLSNVDNPQAFTELVTSFLRSHETSRTHAAREGVS